MATFRDSRGMRDIRAQREAAAVRDKEREKAQKARDAEAAKRAKALADAGKVVAATQGFAYPSTELGGQMRVVKKGEAFHPADEPVQHAPAMFKEALTV